MLTYAIEAGIIGRVPAHGIRKPRTGCATVVLLKLSIAFSASCLRTAGRVRRDDHRIIVDQIALTGCRRSEMIGLKWTEADTDSSCLRLNGSGEGASIRPIGPCPWSTSRSG